DSEVRIRGALQGLANFGIGTLEARWRASSKSPTSARRSANCRRCKTSILRSSAASSSRSSALLAAARPRFGASSRSSRPPPPARRPSTGGLEPATSGEVALEGRAVRGPGGDRGFVFQSDNLLPWRTVFANAIIGREVAGRVGPAERQRTMELLKLVGLEGFEHYHPRQLS